MRLSSLRTWGSDYLRRRARRAWEDDLRVFLKTQEDPYNLEGLELALLHLERRKVLELSVAQRKQLRLTTCTPTVEELMGQVQYAKALIAAGESVTPALYGGRELNVMERSVDDFFTTHAGYVIRPEAIAESLTERTRQLIGVLQTLEADSKSSYPYYMRKMKRLFADLFHTLQSLLEISFQ